MKNLKKSMNAKMITLINMIIIIFVMIIAQKEQLKKNVYLSDIENHEKIY